MEITIAQIKTVPQKGKIQANYLKLMKLLKQIQNADIDVVVTPECFLDGYVCTEEYINAENIYNYAIDIYQSQYINELSNWAKDNGVWLIVGCMRKDETNCYNTAVILNREGNLTGYYDKIHCQTHDKKYQAGNKLDAFDSDFGKFGIMICADRRWPETVRTLALKGANIIFNPSYGSKSDLNLCMMRTRAFESEIFIAFTHPYQSLIIDPQGNIICNVTDEHQEIVITSVDLSLVQITRTKASAHLKDRRTDVYKL